ncbi:MAG: phosphopantetheine-binding protein [Brumimicrobium sp.]
MEEKIIHINDVLADEFEVDVEEISPEANLRDTLDLDSLDYVDLVAVIQSITGVKLEEADFQGIETFSDFYKLLKNKTAD